MHLDLLVEGLAVEPVGGQRQAAARPPSSASTSSTARMAVSAALAMMADAPGPVVGREGQDRDAPVVLEQRAR